MKKLKGLKKLSCLILTAAMLFICSGTVLAAGNVTYDGNARDFIFAPGSEYSPTDLFSDFKNLMPGDSVTQKVTIDNRIDKQVKIKLYMRSLGAEDGSRDFLSKLSLTVKQDGNSELFDAPADSTAQLTDWVYLGTVYSGGKIDLDVTVNVPATLDNSYQDAVGYLDWQFKVEEFPVSSDDPKPAKTGDTFDPVSWVIVMAGSLAVMSIVIIAVRRRKQKSEV